MSVKLGVSSGTYNVRASELARDKTTVKTIKCVIHFLDDTECSFEVDKRAKGQILLDKVFDHLELVEKDYFGLQYADVGPALDTMPATVVPNTDVMRWLDPLKALKKQVKGPPYVLYFRVKFYVSDPSKLQEEYTRYHFFLQLKRDILEGRLMCPRNTAALLASLAVQSELGDYNPEEHANGYLSEFRFIPSQTEEFEREVMDLHEKHRGQTPADAEYNYLDKARRLEMYGVDLHPARVRDQSNLDIQLGVTSAGLVVFQNGVRINTFSWAKIVKISFKRKQFFIQLRRELNDNVDNLIGFNMISYRSCKNLWKSCVEHHTFFRLHVPTPPAKRYFFSLGSKFRYRSAKVGQDESSDEETARSPSKRYARRTVGGTTRNVIMEERNTIDGYRNTPVRNIVDAAYRNSMQSVNTISTVHSVNSNSLPRHSRGFIGNSTAKTYDNYGSNVRNSALYNEQKPRRAWTEGKATDDDGGFLSRSRVQEVARSTRSVHTPTPPPPSSPQKVPPAAFPSQPNSNNTSMNTEANFELPAYNDHTVPNGSAYQDGHGLVTIRMKPDEQGRFGFNVKGGADQGMPIIVSRVAPGTPADLCIPRLNEGDQVLYINGRDVSQHTHEQVVMFIRASRELHSGELVLVVRPNVYIGEEQAEEPDFQYIPDTHHISSTLSHGDALAGSLLLLSEGLESGAALAQFEQMYRKKPGMTMNAARHTDNVAKNRYRDISPYDQTRVVIKGAAGDYINANYVNMEIPGSGIVNRYIAAQGPLPNTCADFWQMVWEQHSTLVVMLTTNVERGRVKCHQYWPQLYETQDFGSLQVSCLKEELTPSFAFRELTLANVEDGGQERHITQMQYIAWPDHGVPEDSSDFLQFVIRVRQHRTGMVEPTIVHCSAGIGRTGVLITMETAMCLIEANQPVYPLDIVRQMRDQRAMLIQNSSQYKFVCEAILRVHNEGFVKPLPEYQSR